MDFGRSLFGAKSRIQFPSADDVVESNGDEIFAHLHVAAEGDRGAIGDLLPVDVHFVDFDLDLLGYVKQIDVEGPENENVLGV